VIGIGASSEVRPSLLAELISNSMTDQRKTMKLVFTILIFDFFISVSAQSISKSINDSCIKTSKTLSIKGDAKLHIYKTCDFANFNFKLYDRWGKLVYETSEFSDPLNLDITQKIKSRRKEKDKYENGIYLWRASYIVTTSDGPSNRSSVGSIKIISNP
jgi:hypothetical protein